MRIEYLGGDDPDVAILGGIHGDEPSVVRAIEHLLEEQPAVQRSVALIIANEKALDAGERYVEEDLNRAFPGDMEGETHESRLAARIVEEISDCVTLALHSTQSYEDMFAIVSEVDEFVRTVCPHLSIDAVVETGPQVEGRIFVGVPRTIELECGYQGSEQAAENARRAVWEFLGAVDALPDARQPPQPEVPLFRLEDPIHKESANTYEVYASNFERIEEGEPFAMSDGIDVIADEGFYPVLLSPYGYEELFGYAATQIGSIEYPMVVEDEPT